MLFMIVASRVALPVPAWALAGLIGVWLVALVLALKWFIKRPKTVVILPLVVVLIWFATVVGGARILGWTW